MDSYEQGLISPTTEIFNYNDERGAIPKTPIKTKKVPPDQDATTPCVSANCGVVSFGRAHDVQPSTSEPQL